MERENYFILLELPFKPPANDKKQILAALEVKKQQWTRLQEVPGKRSFALRYLELAPEIEKVMLDPLARQKEAAAAAELCATMLRRFESELRVVESKGYATAKELSALAVKYRAYGANREMAENLLRVQLSEHPPKRVSAAASPTEMIDRVTARNIQRNLELMGLKDLYAFLGEEPYSSVPKLTAAAEARQAEALQSAAKTAQVTAAQELAGICARLFDSFDNKQRYDRYLKISAYPALSELIDNQFGQAGYISPDMLLRLVNFGVETYGTQVLEMEDFIKRYCVAYNIPIDTKGNRMPCPACHNDTDRDAAVCATCGAQLFGECPGCGTRFEEGPAVCAACGFAIADMVKALQYLGDAENALIENNWSAAQRGLEYARKYWPGHPKIDVLERRAARLEERYDFYVEQVSDCVEHNQYYAALEMLEEAEGRRIRLPKSTAAHVRAVIQDLEEQVDELRGQPHRITFDAISQLTALVSDSIELTRMLAKYPPEPAPSIDAVVEGDHILVNWEKSPATGISEYVLVRKPNSKPKSATDGEVVYEGGATTFTDTQPQPLAQLYYAVYVRRGVTYSRTCPVAGPLRIVPDVRNLCVLPVDQGAQLSWEFNPAMKEVRIWRKLGGEAPVDPGDGIELFCTRLDGFTDTRLKNDVEYWYYVQAGYVQDGLRLFSKGVCDNVVPHKMTASVDSLRVVPTGNEDEYVANWDNSQNADVALLASTTRPVFPPGRMWPVRGLFQEMQKLRLESATPNSARFFCSFNGGIYIAAATVMGRFACISEPCYLTNVRDVRDVASDIIGADLFLNFKWPSENIHEVEVTWRHDRFPKAPGEPGATTITCTREQYDYDAGVLIRQARQENYFIKIFAVFVSADGNRDYSSGQEILVNNTPQMELSYQIRYMKPFFSSNRTLTVTLQASARSFAPPPALLVGKIGRLPLSPSDGVELFRLERQIPINEALTYEYRISALPQDLYVRLFFLDEKQHDRIRLTPDVNLKIT